MKKLILLFFTIIAMNCAQAQDAEDILSVTVGDYTVYLLSEGQRKGNSSILIGATPEMIVKTMSDGTYPSSTNAFLVRTPEKNILVDTGSGHRVLEHLESLGLNADEIDAILLTHSHGDHTGGLLKDKQAAFPNAKLYISQPEYNYWIKAYTQQALPVLNAYENRLFLFPSNTLANIIFPLFPGIFPIAAYGHTPGHTVFLIQTGNDQLLLWGDLTHAMAIQMPYPQIAVAYDVNPEAAIRSREALLKYISDNRMLIGGAHIGYPSIGFIQANDENGYVFMPISTE